MSPEVAARAFEPFFTTKETGRGTGLGLAMVYGIVERWNGHVSIASAPGEGTTVTLLFPISASPPEPLPDKEHLRSPSGGPETVLLVEDESGVRRAGARILESAGYTVLQASDAAEAERLFGLSDVDVLVTDVIMPGGKSGKQLADDLSRRCPDLPVVFVSGYGSEAIAERGVLPASTSLLEKPFTADELLEVVRDCLAETERATI
jgi:two-component system, cell cycle sensor histidine kinase and response regulator CckA